MSGERKSNPTSINTVMALEEAKVMRKQRTSGRDASIRRMLADGLSQREVANEMGVNRKVVQKVSAQTGKSS